MQEARRRRSRTAIVLFSCSSSARKFWDRRLQILRSRVEHIKGERRMNDWFRRFSQRVSEVSGSAWVFALALLGTLVWLSSGPYFRYDEAWNFIANTSTTIITFLMVFLIQNTQNRDAKAIHLKLDELIRALKGARNQLVDLEDLSDEELKKLEEQFQRLRKKAEHNGTRSRNAGSAKSR